MLEMLDRLEKEEAQNSNSDSGNLLYNLSSYKKKQKQKNFFGTDFDSRVFRIFFLFYDFFFTDEGEELSERLSGLNLGNSYQLQLDYNQCKIFIIGEISQTLNII